MIKVLFFAQIREIIGESSLELQAQGQSISELLRNLSQRNSRFALALQDKKVLCSVNKVLVDELYIIQDGDEVAFFPPVTGG
ncbi:molybdopterin synthase sulfur carrier subunit [Zophobihabitans entericus]|uniref:Molybdopterin synthase sulfur carrier subunit n=1 Tax=Zophobihabitans entericus TaxID=1635327 RepID=A0A6G9ID90_9GAMM|nr:molybdopterin synthase sulfur carrier subunit [Zophobihabitans entericus]QIQ21779.1 molybdopterin synthase sulfur carrier subunit [Zophobihabitans entericus]